MNPELEKKLVEDLEKSGFGSEMRAMKSFLSCNWHCTGFADYFDLDIEQTRQIDLHAYKPMSKEIDKENRVRIEFFIEAEVKKSEKPWIVFKEPVNAFLFSDAWGNLVDHYNFGFEPHKLSDAMTNDSLSQILGWNAYGIHESFKRPEAPSRWYPAFATVCKAAESTFEKNFSYYREQKEKGRVLYERDVHGLLFVKPVVILDGMLFAASLTETAEISLEEIKFAPVEFTYKSRNCQKGKYHVDIVALSNLEEYIALSERRQKAMLNALASLYRESAS